MNRNSQRALALVVALGLTLVGASACSDDGDDSAAGGSEITVNEIDASGVSGTATLSEEDGRVRGTIVLTGFEPSTRHAAHIHGVAGEDHGCAAADRTDEHLVNLPDLVANSEGRANLSLDIAAPEGTIRTGTYLMVHANPTADTMETDMDSNDDGASAGPSIVLVHNGEDHSTEEEADAHAAATANPAVACGEFSG